MVKPPLDVHTEWVDKEDGNVEGRALRWDCTECEVSTYSNRRKGVNRCDGCDRLMQAENYSCSGKEPDPQDPKWVLRRVAKRRGLPADYYYPEDEAEAEDPLDW